MQQGFQADFHPLVIPYSIKTIGEFNQDCQKQAFFEPQNVRVYQGAGSLCHGLSRELMRISEANAERLRFRFAISLRLPF
jgi:hypothetical protein